MSAAVAAAVGGGGRSREEEEAARSGGLPPREANGSLEAFVDAAATLNTGSGRGRQSEFASLLGRLARDDSSLSAANFDGQFEEGDEGAALIASGLRRNSHLRKLQIQVRWWSCSTTTRAESVCSD